MYKWRTDNIKKVENCLKLAMEEYKVRKYKEIYKANIDMIRKLVEMCDNIQGVKELYKLEKQFELNGGYYIALVKE